jgi:hypothetical protein
MPKSRSAPRGPSSKPKKTTEKTMEKISASKSQRKGITMSQKQMRKTASRGR